MKKIILLFACVLVMLGGYLRLHSLNEGIPGEVKITTIEPRKETLIEDVGVSVDSQRSSKRFAEQARLDDENYEYIKIELAISNYKEKAIEPFEYINHENIRHGILLDSPGISGEEYKGSKILPGQKKTYNLYYAVEKRNLKKGVYFTLPNSFTKRNIDFSKDERIRNILEFKEVELIAAK